MVLGLGLLLAGGSAQASALTLEQALAQALRDNPDYLAARQETAAAAGARQQAGLLPNPELAFEVEDTRSASQTRSITLTQPFELGGKRAARVAVAEANAGVVDADLEARRYALRADIIQGFYELLLAEEAVRLAKQSQALAQRSLDSSGAQIRAGKLSPVSGTRAEVEQVTQRLELRRALQQRDNARVSLARQLGVSVIELGEPVGDLDRLPEPPGEARLLQAIRQTPAMLKARQQVAAGDADVDLQRSQRYPDVRVSLGSQYDELEGERVNLVGFSLPLPLFDRNQGNLLAASSRADQARDLQRATELQIQAETLQALRDWRSAAADVDDLRNRVMPAGQRTVDDLTRGFSLGRFAQLDVLEAQRALIAARGQYLLAQRAQIAAWARLERLHGPLFTSP
ncbi:MULTISPECIES: TolC family protein [Pseudomonas]|uniref:Outer membrane efflux protein n=2 Tax=Pseudomonas TaxID=286 RepID=A0A178L684_9PSED|nr:MULTISPECIES: TolC family protein [Pseudomonas]MDC7832297.1 TolC family protein [Pseudomonas benzopyrenica]NRH44941.1 TolC family protein [Pseudomonas sp. MS15a(2019)]OAN25009.1 outer membrane efflux protein [Pseudomonas oryzihabitans]HCV76895.1 TolC family protein [Pseudomonas sp.]